MGRNLFSGTVEDCETVQKELEAIYAEYYRETHHFAFCVKDWEELVSELLECVDEMDEKKALQCVEEVDFAKEDHKFLCEEFEEGIELLDVERMNDVFRRHGLGHFEISAEVIPLDDRLFYDLKKD